MVDDTLIGIVLTLIAIGVVLTIIGMIVGARKRAARKNAERIEQERLAETPAPDRLIRDEDATDVPVAPPQPEAQPLPHAEPQPELQPAPMPPPVAPAPPPLADLPKVAPPPAAAEPVIEEPVPLADEPIAAAAPQDASPAAEAQAEPVTPAGPPPGDAPVTQIKGLGPKVAAMLAQQGITTVGQLAALDQRAAEDLDARLGPFTGRMGRDRWLEQAQLLAAGDVKGFEAKFGKL
ncbi:hypothetical protein [Sphingomonas jeddahensis]|nr:hypothetical protein [Sphingomonas jeddahensis]